MKLYSLTVGPIVGDTSAAHSRIWGRARIEKLNGKPRRAFGALRFRPAGRKAWQNIAPFKMNPNFDMTGIGIIEGLKSKQRYDYQFAYFFSDAELDEATFPETGWENQEIYQFRTASNKDTDPRTFAIGSCRYLLKTFLGNIFDDRGDKTFRSINRKIDSDENIDQLVMMGDQIYADDLGPVGKVRKLSKFYKRYRTAFSQPHIRKLMARVPTYMTLDDHEIENNWPSNASEKDWKTTYPNAIHAFQTYQLGHSPNIPVKTGRLIGTPDHHWYNYQDGCCDIFVTDTRTERDYFPDGSSQLISRIQMRALQNWLNDASGRVKIIVSAVPFAPDSRGKEALDKWSGFPDQRIELLEFIEANQIAKVVFFSGDIHGSASLELVSPSGLKVISIISSSFFWPYPHPSNGHFVFNGKIDGGTAGQFSVEYASKLVREDNFTLVNISPTKIDINVYSRKNRLLHSKQRFF